MERYKFDSDFALLGITNLTHWDDFSPGIRKVYNLRKLGDDARIVELGDNVFKSLRGSINARVICQLMLLAYNLKDANGVEVFGTVPRELAGEEPDDFEAIDDRRIKTVHPTNEWVNTLAPGVTNRDRKMAIGYCYLAASYMRLYTKSYQNYLSIADHLRRKFRDFYKFPLPFENYHPNQEIAETIKIYFDCYAHMTLKNTFYNFLYAGELVKEGGNIKDFLYVSHTAYTGLHSYILFSKCMESLEVSHDYLAGLLKIRMFQSKLESLAILFNTLHGTEGEDAKKCQMWRFGRIFDDHFFHTLCTRQCIVFVTTLAHLYHTAVPPQGNQDYTRIAGIQNISEMWKKIAVDLAKRVYEKCQLKKHGSI